MPTTRARNALGDVTNRGGSSKLALAKVRPRAPRGRLLAASRLNLARAARSIAHPGARGLTLANASFEEPPRLVTSPSALRARVVGIARASESRGSNEFGRDRSEFASNLREIREIAV